MIDCTSSLYLGMKHASHELNSWKQLTTGKPAILSEAMLSRQVGNTVAQMQGLKKGLAAPSTLHLYWDLFGMLATQPVVLFIDQYVYPVSKYGIERLTAQQIPVIPFRHFDADDLAGQIRKHTNSRVLPVIITDGWCPVCGAAAPLQQYLQLVKPGGGKIIVDDTQAFGILGAQGGRKMPYGKAGSGLLSWLGINDPNIITMVSMAKAFGVPMSVISSNAGFIRQFAENSQTRINSSPVSMAHLQAAANAFRINNEKGDQLRNSLWQNIRAWQKPLYERGLPIQGGIFPVQSIRYMVPEQTIGLYHWLKSRDIKTVLTTPHGTKQPSLTVLLRSDHSLREIQVLTQSITRYHLSLKHPGNVNTITGNTYRAGSAQDAARLFNRP